jgi:hypothetical protein
MKALDFEFLSRRMAVQTSSSSSPSEPRPMASHPDAMALNGSIPGPPGDGWQQRTLPVLAGLAADEISPPCETGQK